MSSSGDSWKAILEDKMNQSLILCLIMLVDNDTISSMPTTSCLKHHISYIMFR